MLQRSTLPPPPPLAELERAALFLDFDGTLVEIAEGPDAINVGEGLGARLEALAGRLGGRLALVSGRSIDNLTQFLGQLSLHLAGSHGGHVQSHDGEELQEAEPLPPAIGESLGQFAQAHGLLYERKSHGAALHYRGKPDLEGEAHRFAGELAEEHGLATKSGKCVIELVRPGADKGGAVRLLMERNPFAGTTPIFIGDDVTDEDGFAACHALGGFGILVGDRPETAARYQLSTVKDVHAWLNL
ncbi:trehalose-phosphatase [Parerythrobacter aestuarii]|uniref:trehalose-phosphatase n=1 Tax=Parerythrobacter aestuarii TaxID=3020909 RepID=UPI0024DE1549|nr:trehalose-phosphatase [Parerythrobacter aestuarii]